MFLRGQRSGFGPAGRLNAKTNYGSGSTMIMKTKESTVKYSVIQGCFWMAWAGYVGFSSTYLLDVGLTSGQIGIIVAICGLLSALLQPVVAGLVDRKGGNSLKQTSLLLITVSLILTLSLFLWYGRGKYVSGLLFGANIAILQMLAPLVNALAAGNIRTNFSLARGIGSLSYAVMFRYFGALAAKDSVNAVPIRLLFVFAVMAVAVTLYRLEGAELSDGEKEKGSGENRGESRGVSFFSRYPWFMVMLAGVLLLYISHVMLLYFGYQILQTKGGDSAAWGNVGSLGAILELPVMFLSIYFLKVKPASFWVRISGIAFFLQTAGAMVVPDVMGYYAIQIFQPLGWAVLQVCSVYFIREAIAPEDAVKGQSCFTSSYTLATVLGSSCGGLLIDWAGISTMLIFAVAAAGIGALILLLTVPGKNRSLRQSGQPGYSR